MVVFGREVKKHYAVARYWEEDPERKGWVKCRLCYRECRIPPNGYGACGVRKNIDGKLYTLVYGLLTAVNVDPIEKKPLMHFKPGSRVLSISTVGCNFYCKFCQNWEISQTRLEKGLYGEYVEPEEVVNAAFRYGAIGVTYTYNEPTVFYEYMIDVARIARSRGLVNTIVTNGYMRPEPLEELCKYLDAATVDFKGGANVMFYKKYMGVPSPEPIFEFLSVLKDHKVFIEITNLVVPEVGDSIEDLRRLVKWIIDNLGPETPLHLLRFYPNYKMIDYPPTPVETLEKLAEAAKSEGLYYVYIGNVWGHRLENTYCPRCGELLIKRLGFNIEEINLTRDARCPSCGMKQNIIL